MLLLSSNNFFKEMSVFIQSKTDIQCRSHHHKYETKYKYPYRIIKEERNRLEVEGFSFSSALERFSLNSVSPVPKTDVGESKICVTEQKKSKAVGV